MATSNHIHLLVVDDSDRDVIPRSMQLVAGRTGQEYNQRKSRKGAFWEDRYHATAVERGAHLFQCLVYIDLNMVRAGVVNHPAEWAFSGYNEIQEPRQRKALIDYDKLRNVLGIESYDLLKASHREWVEEFLGTGNNSHESKWTQSIAALLNALSDLTGVGSKEFVEKTRAKLGIRAKGRRVIGYEEAYELREPQAPYGDNFDVKTGGLRFENTYLWNIFPDILT